MVLYHCIVWYRIEVMEFQKQTMQKLLMVVHIPLKEAAVIRPMIHSVTEEELELNLET
jgi:hypothetical protein